MTQVEYARHSGLTAGRVSQLVKRGMPLTSPEAADAWRGKASRTAIIPKSVSGSSADTGPYRPPEAQVKTGAKDGMDNAHGAYERQRQIEREAFALCKVSLREGRPDAGRLVAIHAQAAKNLVQAREDVLALSERERSLVSGDWVRKIMSEHDGAVVALAKAMPRQLAGRISPHDPEHCERELDRWVQEVFLKTLHETDPWK